VPTGGTPVMTRRGWVLFIALGIIWGLPYLLIKVSVREISPAFLVFVRTGGAALVLVPLAAARGQIRPLFRFWRPLVAYTAVELAVPWVLLFHAEQRLSSSLSGLLIAAVPLVGALLAWLTRSDRLDPRRVIGLAVGFAGVALLVGFAVGRSNLWAAVSIGGVVVGYALGPWVVARHLSKAPPLGVIAGSFILCAVAYSPIAAFQVPRHVSASVVESVVALTVVCTVVAFLVFFALIAEVGAYRATVITYVNPAVAVLLGVTILGEKFGVATAVGFGLILVGCFFATRTTRVPEEPELKPSATGGANPGSRVV
jgi:drug/metabolite transporter (DMT)-like permease